MYQGKVEKDSLERLQELVRRFVMLAKEEHPELLMKSKTHMLLHFPTNMKDFGPSKCYCTERCEQFMGLVRTRCIYSNYRNLSRDVTAAFAKLLTIDFIMRGGVWQEGVQRKQCGPRLIQLYNSTPVQSLLNSDCTISGKTPGQLAIKNAESDELNEEDIISIRRLVGFDLEVKDIVNYGGVVPSERRLIRLGQKIKYTDDSGIVSYGILRKCVNVKGRNVVGIQTFTNINRYCVYNCLVLKLTNDIIYIDSVKVVGHACVQHICEKTTCRVIIVSKKIINKIIREKKFQHNENYLFYRINKFIISS
ncbi:uncharacterized protein [Ptychodera flava]|uniref:uncharacterized protein n=1 Tax=Ptychodera flava TaxID=63121 RepID=UPI003969C8DE